MHMADALLSPAVGGTMWAVAAGAIYYCSSKIKKELDDRKIPLMGVLGAFVFAAQMINFSIPGTGSSGHLGGGLLLAILLGPHAAFLTIASVLAVQALFFADGGLLALGCNIFNLGVFPCFIAYPFIYKKILPNHITRGRLAAGSIISAIVSLQLGAFGVVVQTIWSGVTELSFSLFVLLIQSIHLAIGLLEGLATAGLLSFIWKARPEILEKASSVKPSSEIAVKKVLVGFGIATLLIGGVFSWFASEHPDGLDWSLSHAGGVKKIESSEKGIHSLLVQLQEKISFLPDYGFKNGGEEISISEFEDDSGKVVDAGATLSGLIGGFLTLMLAFIIGMALRKRKQPIELHKASP